MAIALLNQDFEQKVLQSTLPVLAYFQSEWCSACKGLSPVVEKLSDAFSGKVNFFKIDTLSSVNTAATYSVLSTPTLILFKEGKEIRRNIGFISEQNLKNLIEREL